ncbi:hypothetical protein CCACVL1_24077 [Corchorus capsularis]|uniref:Uncharacterized protein n=1 Tax=Corchorus capsularis TaxID=210143 RepID=A0A1R3GQY5_COCAP|nr:hypothetical protein CCACVL1_24077 [Corchorus capsularis]
MASHVHITSDSVRAANTGAIVSGPWSPPVRRVW